MAFLISAIADNFSNPGGLWEFLILRVFKFITNYGWRIVFFTLCLKVLLLPLDLYQRFKMRKNQIITERLKPQLEKLQEQYAGDSRTLSQKQMELNRKEGFSYFSSCLPLIVTLVIFFYLFSGLNSISHYRIFAQYVELYDAYTVEETVQKKVARDGVLGTDEIDALLDKFDGASEYFNAKTPDANDYKTAGDWYESGAEYVKGETTYAGGEADYMRALDEYNAAKEALAAAVDAISAKKNESAVQVSWDELTAWRTAVDATEPTESAYRVKFGEKLGEWKENGETDYQAAREEWNNAYFETTQQLLTKSGDLYAKHILKPAQDAAVKRYGEVEESFLWVHNIWSPDVPWRDAILDYDSFLSNITSDYTDFDSVVDELDAKVNDEFNRTVFDNMMSRTTYNNVTGSLRAEGSEYDVVNGYLILPLLSVGLSFLSQFITSRLQKKSGQVSAGGNMAGSMKMMMIIMPLMMGIFALTYTAMFTLYIVVNSGVTILMNVLTTLLMGDPTKKKGDKVGKDGGVEIRKYGRPDPKDL